MLCLVVWKAGTSVVNSLRLLSFWVHFSKECFQGVDGHHSSLSSGTNPWKAWWTVQQDGFLFWHFVSLLWLQVFCVIFKIFLPRFLRNLCACKEATVRTGHGTADWFQIGKGVRQGCILSPCLFDLCEEYIIWNAGLDETQAGIKIVRRNIKTQGMQMIPLSRQKAKRN